MDIQWVSAIHAEMYGVVIVISTEIPDPSIHGKHASYSTVDHEVLEGRLTAYDPGNATTGLLQLSLLPDFQGNGAICTRFVLFRKGRSFEARKSTPQSRSVVKGVDVCHN